MKLLNLHRVGTVCLASWLAGIGISYDLQKRYRKSGWLKSIGTGAFVRVNETVNWEGGLYAIQQQLNLPVHVGGLTALAMQGLGHYMRTGAEKVFLYSPLKVKLPAWFLQYPWNADITHIRTSILPNNTGLLRHEEKTFFLIVSAPERAMLECLHVAPEQMDLVECYHLMEGLVNLRPKLLQQLLEDCTSIKVKRLFLYLASKTSHQWLKFLDKSKIDLGKGDRSIVPGGVYISAYQITVPRKLVEL